MLWPGEPPLRGEAVRCEVRPLSDAIGAEVLGVDLREPPGEDLARALNDALLEHIVLVIRDQDLTPAQYLAAMRAFGVPQRQNSRRNLLDGFPEIWVLDSRRAERRADGTPILNGATAWHTDHTNLERPPKITALYPRLLPPSGGSTCFANAYACYERLPDETRARIDPLRAVNGRDRHLPAYEEDAPAFATPAVHPLVRTHPETGRRALYCHPLKVQHFEGMAPEESFELIDGVIDEAIAPEIVYRHHWRIGDLGLIDNRACLHLAQRDYDPAAGRVIHRIIIEGDRPV